MAIKRRVNMPKPFVKAVALSGAVVASALFAFSANAAQVLTPKRSAVAIDTASLPAGTTVPAGTTLFIDMDYSVTGSQTQDEAGLGLKIGYDSNFFDLVVPATSITALHTKCMIASPSDQLVSGTTREVVFGWIDTSIRTTPSAGAVGWPGTADPAAPGTANGCLNPGSIVTESGAVAVPATLFRIGLKTKNTFTSGSTNVTVNTAGNISYANAGNVDTAKTILVNGAAAPTCSLDVDGSGGVPSASIDGLLIKRALNSFIPAANILAGITLPVSATRTTGADIRAYVLGLGNILDVDTNGTNVPAASVDGLLIQRALNTFIASTSITTGITTPTTGSAVRTYLNNNCGTTLVP
jgi:hypothetical protein